MARLPRVVVVDVPHHVTQRGNARQIILATHADRLIYMALLREYAQLYRLSLLGYCLMSNHVHLIAVPHTETALAESLKQVHGRYAACWNGQQSSTGHVWQGRFYSCPLDEGHLWEGLRYVELNPVRAGLEKSRSSGHGRALRHTADSRALILSSKCGTGLTVGRSPSGVAFWRSRPRAQRWEPCAASLTQAARWVPTSLSPDWNLRCCVRWPPEKEAARRKPLPIHANSASPQLPDGKKKRGRVASGTL